MRHLFFLTSPNIDADTARQFSHRLDTEPPDMIARPYTADENRYESFYLSEWFDE